MTKLSQEIHQARTGIPLGADVLILQGFHGKKDFNFNFDKLSDRLNVDRTSNFQFEGNSKLEVLAIIKSGPS